MIVKYHVDWNCIDILVIQVKNVDTHSQIFIITCYRLSFCTSSDRHDILQAGIQWMRAFYQSDFKKKLISFLTPF